MRVASLRDASVLAPPITSLVASFGQTLAAKASASLSSVGAMLALQFDEITPLTNYAYKASLETASVALSCLPPAASYIVIALFSESIFNYAVPPDFVAAAPVLSVSVLGQSGQPVGDTELLPPIEVTFPLDSRVPQIKAMLEDIYQRKTRTPLQIIQHKHADCLSREGDSFQSGHCSVRDISESELTCECKKPGVVMLVVRKSYQVLLSSNY